MSLGKQDWIVQIRMTESEGDPKDTTKPWYEGVDIATLVEGTLRRAGDIRDLKINSVIAVEDGQRYYPFKD